MTIQQCQTCGKPAVLHCPGCSALGYCSQKHLARHHRLGHSEECHRMQQQVLRAQELAEVGLGWSFKMPSCEAEVCGFLRDLGAHHHQGLLSRLCRCNSAAWGFGGSALISSFHPGDSLAEACRPAQIPASHLPDLTTAVSDGRDIRDWPSYYAARKLAPDSIVAMVADTVLTLHLGIRCLMQSKRLSHIIIHILGCQRELDEWPLFLELACLWPDVSLGVMLCATEMHPALRGQMVSWTPLSGTGNIMLQFEEGCYHDVMDGAHQADLVFCPNAGIAAYDSWQATIKLLCKAAVPTLVTDFCEEAAFLARQAVCCWAGGRPVSALEANAFRSPLSCQGEDNLLPSYGNCFLFWLSKPLLQEQADLRDVVQV